MSIGIKSIEYVLPAKIVTNRELATLFGDWSAEKIFAKTGISSRHVVEDGVTAADLAEEAALKLFSREIVQPKDIDFIMLATQSPDYLLPTTACLLQSRIGIPKTAGALDFNLGCSAYIYGLALAKGLISAGIAKNVLLLTAETYSKYLHPMDRGTRTIFGDAAAATLISNDACELGEFDLGTDGDGGEHLIIPVGGAKQRRSGADGAYDGARVSGKENLFMAGAEIFNFTIEVVPQSVNNILLKHQITLDDIDLFVFHQANQFILNYLRKKIGIPEQKFYVNIGDIGNTVSASIPIALKRAEEDGLLKDGDKVLLTGFGVGLSWGSTLLTWKDDNI